MSAPDLEKVIALFQGPNSSDLYERHCTAIQRLCKEASSQGGFAIRDLPRVQQVLELTLKLLSSGVGDFLQPAVDLLK